MIKNSSVRSINELWTELIYKDQNGDLLLRNINLATNATRTLLAATDPVLTGASDFQLSADKKYLLVAHAFQKIYRYSYKARYTIVDLENNEQIELAIGSNLDFSLVVWSPIGNGFAFVYETNIYYKSQVRTDEILQITKDPPFVFNGIPDWVYEEEVFSSNKALWFSPDGRKLAFGKFDDRTTPIMVLPIYGEPASRAFQYPRAQLIKYPKAGTPNPIVSLHYVDLDNITVIKQLEPPNDLVREPILSTVAWANGNNLIAIWMNRVQNRASIVGYLTEEPYTTEIIKTLKEDVGWLELFTPPKFSEDGSKLALILSYDQGANLGSYRHVVLLNRQENATIEPLTKGAFVVTEILSWNYANDSIYYLANTVNDTGLQHLYSISIDKKEVECLSCNIKSKANNEDCLYNSAEFSEDSSHFVLTCGGPDIPDIAIYSAIQNKKIVDWESNDVLKNLKQTKETPIIKRMSFPIDDDFNGQVMLKLPPNFDSSGKVKYPMLVNVYAGPDSNLVTEKFNFDWGSYLAANKSIIYATIDGRGSGLKGDKILFAPYRHLGTVEIIDQINVTRQIQKSLPYVDATKTAIWGWSYGGYASGMILSDDKDGVFKCGISVAPVTDWTLYDSIYTERFMGLPSIEDNYVGYRDANLLNKFESLRNKQYFLIHGTLDDNVHYQQSMMWSKVLEQNDILFRQLSYPDEDHGLASVRPHLYHSLENFLDECFINEQKNH